MPSPRPVSYPAWGPRDAVRAAIRDAPLASGAHRTAHRASQHGQRRSARAPSSRAGALHVTCLRGARRVVPRRMARCSHDLRSGTDRIEQPSGTSTGDASIAQPAMQRHAMARSRGVMRLSRAFLSEIRDRRDRTRSPRRWASPRGSFAVRARSLLPAIITTAIQWTAHWYSADMENGDRSRPTSHDNQSRQLACHRPVRPPRPRRAPPREGGLATQRFARAPS